MEWASYIEVIAKLGAVGGLCVIAYALVQLVGTSQEERDRLEDALGRSTAATESLTRAVDRLVEHHRDETIELQRIGRGIARLLERNGHAETDPRVPSVSSPGEPQPRDH